MRHFALVLAAALLLATPAAHAALTVQFTPGTAITVTGSSQALLVSAFSITNTGNQSLRLGVARQIISEVLGSQNNICFSTGCYPPSVSVSPQTVTIAPGATDYSFIGDYEPLGNSGITIIRYAVYDADNGVDSAYVTVTYDARSSPAGIANDLLSSALLSAPAPNPAVVDTEVVLHVAPALTAAAAQLQVIDLRDGRCVQSMLLSRTGAQLAAPAHFSDGAIRFSTSGLAAGVYGCLVVGSDGRPRAMSRLVVQ